MKISIVICAVLIFMGAGRLANGEVSPTSIGLIVIGIISGVFAYMNIRKAAKYKIDADGVKKLLKKGAVLVDVRESDEYSGGHIPRAISVPLSSFENKISKKVKDKNRTVIVYCLSGGRSSMALNKLLNMGYTDVYNLGGISNWPYEIEK